MARRSTYSSIDWRRRAVHEAVAAEEDDIQANSAVIAQQLT